MLRYFFILLTLLLINHQVTAQEAKPTMQTVERLNQQIAAAYQGKKWNEALDLSEKALRLLDRIRSEGGNELATQIMLSNVYYNAACVASLAGQADRAADYLRNAVSEGFINVEHLEVDPDLENVRAKREHWDELLRFAAAELERVEKENQKGKIIAPPENAQPTGAIIALHGVGQSIEQFEAAWAGVAEETGRLVILLRGGKYAGKNMFYWDEADIQQSSQRIEEWITRARGEYPTLDDNKLIIAGYSQGGAVAWSIATLGRRPWQGVVTYGAYIPDILVKTPGAFTRISYPAFAAVGAEDTALVLQSHHQMQNAFVKQFQPFQLETIESAGHDLPENAANVWIRGVKWVEAASKPRKLPVAP